MGCGQSQPELDLAIHSDKAYDVLQEQNKRLHDQLKSKDQQINSLLETHSQFLQFQGSTQMAMKGSTFESSAREEVKYQSFTQKELEARIRNNPSRFELQRAAVRFTDNYEPSERISRQCIAAFSQQIFGTDDPDPTTHKMQWRGSVGPRSVNYDNPNTGQIQFRDDCNVIPEFGGMLFNPTTSRVPAAYQVAINAVQLPLQTQDPEYQNAFANYNAALKAQGLQADTGRNQFTQYLLASKNNGIPPAYTDWMSYMKAEDPAGWAQYQLTVQNSASALQDLQDVQDKLKDNAVLDAIQSFNAWSKATERGTKGMDSYWGWSPDAAQFILQWKQGSYSGGGSFSVSAESKIYERVAASGNMSLLFDFVKIGASGSGSSVFDSSSAYNITYSWKASATIAATPPGKAYNFALLQQYRNGPISPSYPGHKPLTGESKSPLSNVITSQVLMFGLSMTATFDSATYSRIEQQANIDVVSFGFFSIGVNQTYTKTTYNRQTYSVEVTADETPFIVAYYTDTLTG